VTPVTRRRRGAARVRIATAAVLAALVATVSLLGPAAATGTTSTTTGSSSNGPPALTLVAQSAWVGPTGTFEIRFDGPLPTGAQIVARIYVPISTQSQLASTSEGNDLGDVVQRVTVPAAQVARAADGSFRLDYPFVAGGTVPTYGFHLSNPGVYPFVITVESTDGTVTEQLSTQLIRLPESGSDIPPLLLSVVLPYGAPLSRSPQHDPDLSATTVSSLGDETTTLGQYPSVPVMVAPVPETIDTLADRDRTIGSTAVGQLRAAIGSRPVVASTYVPVDSGAWVSRGLLAGFDRQLDVGASTIASQLGARPVPDVAITDPTTTDDVLSAEFAHGTREVVVASNRLASSDETQSTNGPLTQWFDLAASNGQRIQGVPADSNLDAELDASHDPVLAAHRVLAALALVSLDRSDAQACVRPSGQSCRRGLAVELPADASRAAPALQVLLAALSDPTARGGVNGLAVGGLSQPPAQGSEAASALVAPVGVRDFLRAVDPAAESGITNSGGAHQLRHLEARDVASLGDYPAAFNRVSNEIASFTSMVSGIGATAGVELASSWDELVLASGAVELSSSARDQYLVDVESDLQGQTSQITAPTQQTVTLTSASGRIPFSLSNPLPYPVKVALVFESPKLHFVAGNTQVVILPARQPRHLQIAVTARASGAFPMQVTVTSPDGGMTITQTHFDVRSTAISAIGLALTLAAGLFLLLWWARHFRDGRRQRRLVESSHPVLRT
jgi:Family of unknown function (DUF6049)